MNVRLSRTRCYAYILVLDRFFAGPRPIGDAGVRIACASCWNPQRAPP